MTLWTELPPHVTIGDNTYNLDGISIPEHGANKFVPIASEATGVATLVGSEESAAPLIVEGGEESGEFVPDSGQPTFEEARAAFLSGRPVFLKMGNLYFLVVEASTSAISTACLEMGASWAK